MTATYKDFFKNPPKPEVWAERDQADHNPNEDLICVNLLRMTVMRAMNYNKPMHFEEISNKESEIHERLKSSSSSEIPSLKDDSNENSGNSSTNANSSKNVGLEGLADEFGLTEEDIIINAGNFFLKNPLENFQLYHGE